MNDTPTPRTDALVASIGEVPTKFVNLARQLEHELTEAREIAKKYEDRFFIADHELAEALKRADAEYAHAKSLQETINLLNVANKVADQDGKAMERLIAVLQVENGRLRDALAFYAEPKHWIEGLAHGRCGEAHDGEPILIFDGPCDGCPTAKAANALNENP